MDKKQWQNRNIFLVAAYILIISATIVIDLIFQPAINSLVLILGITFLGAWYLIYWNIKNTAFRCRHCHHAFQLTWVQMLTSPHIGLDKLVKCPNCHKTDMCKGIPASQMDKSYLEDSLEEDIGVDVNDVDAVERWKKRLRRKHIGIVLGLYGLMWIVTLLLYPQLPDQIPVHFGAGGSVSYGDKSMFLMLPLIIFTLPILHIGLINLGIIERHNKAFFWILTITFGTILALLVFLQVFIWYVAISA